MDQAMHTRSRCIISGGARNARCKNMSPSPVLEFLKKAYSESPRARWRVLDDWVGTQRVCSAIMFLAKRK